MVPHASVKGHLLLAVVISVLFSGWRDATSCPPLVPESVHFCEKSFFSHLLGWECWKSLHSLKCFVFTAHVGSVFSHAQQGVFPFIFESFKLTYLKSHRGASATLSWIRSILLQGKNVGHCYSLGTHELVSWLRVLYCTFAVKVGRAIIWWACINAA